MPHQAADSPISDVAGFRRLLRSKIRKFGSHPRYFITNTSLKQIVHFPGGRFKSGEHCPAFNTGQRVIISSFHAPSMTSTVSGTSFDEKVAAH